MCNFTVKLKDVKHVGNQLQGRISLFKLGSQIPCLKWATKTPKEGMKALSNLCCFCVSGLSLSFIFGVYLFLSHPPRSHPYLSLRQPPAVARVWVCLWLYKDVTCRVRRAGTQRDADTLLILSSGHAPRHTFENTLRLICTSPLETLERLTELWLLRLELAVCGH